MFWDGSPVRFSLFNVSTRQQTTLLSHPNYNIQGAELSPDRKWVAFHVQEAGQGAGADRTRSERTSGKRTRVARGCHLPGGNRRPWWSSNGNQLFFLSDRDGTFCIWAQHLGSCIQASDRGSCLNSASPRSTPEGIFAETNTGKASAPQ